ncbi:MAG TPA: arylsulfatase [Gemmataceae bacterium]|nr:arylsulfatase [Gemmataceae bacterium]
MATLRLTLVIAFGLMSDSAAAAKPNVIILLTDDQGYGDLSCHGNPILKTPNFDRLHGQAIRLTDFHVAPMCSPTRGQLLTGMDALCNGAASVSAGRSLIRPGIPTLPEAFAAGGYKTALFGKWHLGDSYPNLPHYKGFHEAVYHLGWGITSMADTWENDLFDGRFFHNGKLERYKGYCTDVFFDLAMAWMKDRAAKNEPFLLYLPTNAPHAPHWVPAKYKEPYLGKGPAAFFGMVANIDENLGRLERFLADSRLKDDTILIFFNDNGATAGGKAFNAGMRGQKTTYYEGGHRAACFIRWPNGGLGQPRDIRELTQVQDLFPTVLDLCGIDKPKAAKFDGANLAGLLKGTQDKLPSRTLVVQYGEQPGGQKLEKDRACVMRDRWRLVHGAELYDLASDPGEQTNIAGKRPEELKQLKDYYEQWWKAVEPLTEDFVPIIVGADEENPVTLSSADWAKVYCDNMNDLRTGANKNGPWYIQAAKAGEYQITLRRWPKAADAALAAGVPAFRAVDGALPEGRALPVAKARLKVADLDETRPVAATDKEAVFSVRLAADRKLPMQTWLYDADGKELCGAFFAYVRRK